MNVRLFGGHDTDALLTSHTSTAAATVDELTGVLAGLAGFFADAARQPPAAGLPTLRAFQDAQAKAVLQWLRDRTGA